MQGIFQYNNVLGSPSQRTVSTHRRSLCPIRALENQHVSPGMGQYGCTQYFYDIYVKSAESRSFQTSHG